MVLLAIRPLLGTVSTLLDVAGATVTGVEGFGLTQVASGSIWIRNQFVKERPFS